MSRLSPIRAALFLTLLLASCVPQPASVAEPTSIPSPTEAPPPAHAPEIRFALIGQPHAVNVWALFDEAGASYANYAIYSEYWPRLYHIVPQDSSFQPFAADGIPSEVTQADGLYSASVTLRTDLKWTDGSPFTAEDVAFTVNTVLAFELGYNWHTYYSPDYLLRAEVIDVNTVKYFFKQKPNVGVWQYGALQSPIVQKAFWEPLISNIKSALPSEESRTQIEEARRYLASIQSSVNDLTAKAVAIRITGQEDRQLEGNLVRRTAELGFAQNNLDKLLEDDASVVRTAHQKLYQLEDTDEPMLGVWMPGGETTSVWTNVVNPDFPFGMPNFDRAVYRGFENEASALSAFQNNEVDFVLSPNEIGSDLADAKYYPSDRARFLVFNPLNAQLADPAFRAALDCMIDRSLLASAILQNMAVPLDSFILSSQWHDSNIKNACTGMDASTRIAYAVKLLKDAGYSWGQEPNADRVGQNLLLSSGESFPHVNLLAPSKDEDALRYAAAKYIAEQAQYLGISFSAQEVSLNDIVYAVYSSQKYDMAMMGWRLSEYPAYVCEWVGGQTLFLYNSSRFTSTCDAFGVESNLGAARSSIQQVESALLSELPFLPLFTVARADVYRNLSYPVQNIRNGWSGLYGAPSYAMPSP